MENKLTVLKSEFNGIIAIKTNVQNAAPRDMRGSGNYFPGSLIGSLN